MNTHHANVQGKIPCIYEIKVSHENQSNKRNEQNYNVVATNILIPEIINNISNISTLITEKIDGTCSLIQKYEDKPWMWLRHDRKPIKSNKIMKNVNVKLNVETDYKEAPSNWVPSKDCFSNGRLIPDPINGHLMGWIPIDPKSRQHCWHLNALSDDLTKALILSYNSNQLTLSYHPIEGLLDTTLELIGTNINANPYKLGSKRCPIHFFIIHGSIPIVAKVDLNIENIDSINKFFNTPEGQIEGIVWHYKDLMYKLHRHHIKQKWPIDQPYLCSIPLLVNFNGIEISSALTKAMIKLAGNYANLSDFSKEFIIY